MTDELFARVSKLFHDEIQGGCSNDMWGMMDRFIEDGYLTQEEWQLNEVAICSMFDDSWFTCEGCGWTMPVAEMNMDADWHCEDCAGEERA